MSDYLKFAQNHIRARTSKKFDPVDYSTPEDMMSHLNDGRTFEFILNRIEDTLVHPMDVINAHNGTASKGYQDAVEVGFLLFTEKLKTWKM